MTNQGERNVLGELDYLSGCLLAYDKAIAMTAKILIEADAVSRETIHNILVRRWRTTSTNWPCTLSGTTLSEFTKP